MKKLALGIDTSCYTTSVAIMDEDFKIIFEERKLLDIPFGKKGLAQSEMIFQHTKVLPILLENAFNSIEGSVDMIGVSAFPRRQQESYMPVFLSGFGYAKSLAAALRMPLFLFSHQEGHIWASAAAEIFSERKRCYGIQSSGGTLEGIEIHFQSGGEMDIQILLESEDISLGQLIDRIGVRCGLPFPAGPHFPLVDLLQRENCKIPVSIRGKSIFLAGAETHLLRKYSCESEEIMGETLFVVAETLRKMCDRLGESGDSIILGGGTLANPSIRRYLEKKVDRKLFFPLEKYSSDNAVGIARATLASWRKENLCGT